MAVRIKAHWHNEEVERSLDDIAGALAFIAWRLATDKAITLHGADFVYLDDAQRMFQHLIRRLPRKLQIVRWLKQMHFIGFQSTVVILLTGIAILRESSDDLMDTVPGRELQEQIQKVVKNVPDVQSIEEIHAHRFGPYLVVNITIGIEGALSVADGDRIATRVEQTLCNRIDLLQRVHVHYHPSSGGMRRMNGETCGDET